MPEPIKSPPMPTAYAQALREALARIVALQDRPLPPGLAMRRRDDGSDLIDVLSRGRVIGAVSASAIDARAVQLAVRDRIN